MKHRTHRAGGLAIAALAGILALTACSGSTAEAPGDSGSGAASGDKPSIAVFYAEGNAYLTAGNESAKAAADELGVDITLFNSGFDPQQQLNQIETAVTQGGYDAFVIGVLDGNLLCDYVRENLIEQDIPVVTFQGTLCGHDTERGEAQLEEGVFAHVTGQNLEIYETWMEEIAAQSPAGGKVAVLSGPPIQGNTVNLNEALKTLPDSFEVVANQTTDYTTPDAFSKAQTMLQANPDIDLFISNYSGVTQGVVEAVKAADSAAKIFDFGGDEWALGAVASGEITATVMLFPATETATAIRLAVDALGGEPSPGVVDLTRSDAVPGTVFVTKENASEFTPEY